MDFDEQVFQELIEESQDTHLDTMKQMREVGAEVVELGHRPLGEAQEITSDGRRLRPPQAFFIGALGALGFGAAMLAAAAPAGASQSADVKILRNAASIEVLAVATYGTALDLPFIGGASANPVVAAFARTTMAQHQQHLATFNSLISQLGGSPQTSPDPALLAVVNRAKPGLTTPLAVVELALELEQGATEAYVADVSSLSANDKDAIRATASIMGVEAQHAAILRAVAALLRADAPQLIALSPTVVASLPAAAGSVGFPTAFIGGSGSGSKVVSLQG